MTTVSTCTDPKINAFCYGNFSFAIYPFLCICNQKIINCPIANAPNILISQRARLKILGWIHFAYLWFILTFRVYEKMLRISNVWQRSLRNRRHNNSLLLTRNCPVVIMRQSCTYTKSQTLRNLAYTLWNNLPAMHSSLTKEPGNTRLPSLLGSEPLKGLCWRWRINNCITKYNRHVNQ